MTPEQRRVLTLEDIHLKLYRHSLTIYCCPDDSPEQWFIMPNPAFLGVSYTPSGQKKGEYKFKILGKGITPQAAYEDWQGRRALAEAEGEG